MNTFTRLLYTSSLICLKNVASIQRKATGHSLRILVARSKIVKSKRNAEGILRLTVVTNLLVFEDLGRLRRHAVHAPVGLPVPVADGDAEAPEVPTDNLDQGTGVVGAAHRHVLALAAVVGLVAGAIAGHT